MITRVVMFVLSTLALRSQRNAFESQDSLFHHIVATVRYTVSDLGFKLLLGAILASTIVFSIIQIGSDLNTLVTSLENGLMIKLCLFGGVFVTCSVLLYFIFHKKTREVSDDVELEPPTEETESDQPDLIARFAAGFVEGLKKERDS